MMKGIIIFFAFLLFCSCQDDETSFSTTIPKESLSFRPMPGGAVMYYQLPADPDVLSIRVRYLNALGKETIRTGSYASDSLILVGFNEARQNVEASVTLCHRNGQESEPSRVTFNTEDSGPVAFFNYVKVKPSWDGFSVSYDLPSDMKGIAHILYLGKNPLTQQEDTILISSITFAAGENVQSFELQQKAAANTVVIRTEDFQGYTVKQQVYKDILAYKAEKLSADELEFIDPYHLSMEDEGAMLGAAYLFDGDTKGEACWDLGEDYLKTFLAGPQAVGKPFIIDMKEEKLPAMIRVYAMLHVREYGSGYYWSMFIPYYTRVPSQMRWWGSNDLDDDNSWVELGHYAESPSLDLEKRWCEKVLGSYNFRLNSLDEVKVADPAYFTISFPSDGENYRYLKFVVEDIYLTVPSLPNKENTEKYISFHELEVYTKKD